MFPFLEFCRNTQKSLSEFSKDYSKLPDDPYNQIALSRLPISIMGDYTIQTIRNSPQSKIDEEKSWNSRTITDY